MYVSQDECAMNDVYDIHVIFYVVSCLYDLQCVSEAYALRVHLSHHFGVSHHTCGLWGRSLQQGLRISFAGIKKRSGHVFGVFRFGRAGFTWLAQRRTQTHENVMSLLKALGIVVLCCLFDVVIVAPPAMQGSGLFGYGGSAF